MTQRNECDEDIRDGEADNDRIAESRGTLYSRQNMQFVRLNLIEITYIVGETVYLQRGRVVDTYGKRRSSLGLERHIWLG